jgi:hypothetical protein
MASITNREWQRLSCGLGRRTHDITSIHRDHPLSAFPYRTAALWEPEPSPLRHYIPTACLDSTERNTRPTSCQLNHFRYFRAIHPHHIMAQTDSSLKTGTSPTDLIRESPADRFRISNQSLILNCSARSGAVANLGDSHTDSASP